MDKPHTDNVAPIDSSGSDRAVPFGEQGDSAAGWLKDTILDWLGMSKNVQATHPTETTQPVFDDGALKLWEKQAQLQAHTEYPDDVQAAQWRAQEIMYSTYGVGHQLEPKQSDYLLEEKAEMQAKAQFRTYTGADKEELIVFAKREILSLHGFKALSLSDQEKVKLEKARAALHK
jgi:hypothetical protein